MKTLQTPRKTRRFLNLALILALLLAGLPVSVRPAQASSAEVVIGEFRVRGPNGGNDEFIELYNRSSSPVDIGGWRVKGSNNTGAVSTRATLPAGTVINPGCYYLLTNSSTSAGPYSGAVPGDQTYGVGITDTGGIGLFLPDDVTIVDQVGLSEGSAYKEGTPLASLGTANLDRSYERLPGGTAGSGTDSDDNASDFRLISPSDPQNSSSPCVDSGLPSDPFGTGAADPALVAAGDSTLLTVAVTPGANPPSTGLSVSGDLTPIGGAATQAFYDDGTNGDEAAGDNLFSFLAGVDGATPPGVKSLEVTISDEQERTASVSISLEVLPPPVAIYDIQGDGHTSPLVGTRQMTSGVITVALGNGFFMQDPLGDENPATSDGIFVFTGSGPASDFSPGDEVTVAGTVTEFRPSSRPRDLTLTELTSVTVIKTGSEASLPDPALIHTRPDLDIFPDGMDAFEALEGMLVEIAAPLVTGPTNQFGEFVVIAEGNHGSATPSGSLLVRPLGGDAVDYNPERIMVDDEARVGGGSSARVNAPQAQVIVGDRAGGSIVGALDYQFSNYRVQASHPLSEIFASTTPASPISGLRQAGPYEGRIATFNVENLFDCVDAPGKDDRASCSAGALAALETQLAKLALAFEQELLSPEIVIIEETENTLVLTGDENGFVPGTSVPALLPRLSGNWEAVSADSSDERGIEVGFVFNTDRARLHDYFLSTDILPDSQGLFDGSVYRAGREPLVGFFTLDDIDVIVIGNHFKSKGGPQFTGDPDDAGDDPLYGEFQPPVRWTEGLRHKQADYVRSLVDLLLGQNPGANLVVGGDLNDFPFPEPGEGLDTVGRITSSSTYPLSNVIELVSEDERYTFVFEGNSQVLDHLLVNAGLEALLRDQAVAHFNANFPDSYSSDGTLAFRSSDHDPLVAYICSDATPPALNLSATPGMLWPPDHRYVDVAVALEATDNADPAVSWALVSATSNEPDNGLGDGDQSNDILILDELNFQLRAERSGLGSGRVYSLTYMATDACGNSTLATAEVSVPRNFVP